MKLDSSELKNQIQLARDLARAKEYAKAERIFVSILKKHQLADVQNSLGLCYADRGNFNAAEFCFQKALQINPNYMEAALNLAVMYNNLGEKKKSKDIYKKLRRYGAKGRGAIDPLLLSKIANLYSEAGDLFNSVGEYKEAIQAYEKAVELCPAFIDIQTKLAIAYREDGKKKKALEIFEKNKRKASKYAPYWVGLGVTYYSNHEPEKAKRAWQKALKIDPANRAAKNYLKLDLSGGKRKKKASKKKSRRKKK